MELKPGGTPQRTGMRRVVVVVPSAFTLGNLFFGLWAIVAAYNGGYLWAGWFIMFAVVLDGIDGRVARASNTGTRFGAELDSLVDVISFGVAPALVVYFEDFATLGKFAWVLCFLYVTCTAIRLARYNVHAAHGGRPSAWFTGLPSPAAGATLAVSYAFTQTAWYPKIAPANAQFQGTAILMIVLAFLMVSNVKYPRFPTAGFRTVGQLGGLAMYVVILVGGVTVPAYFLFPLGLTYVVFGVLRAVVIGLAERNDDRNEDDDRTVSLVHPASRVRRAGRHREHHE